MSDVSGSFDDVAAVCACLQHVQRRTEWRWRRWIKGQTAAGESEAGEVSAQTSEHP